MSAGMGILWLVLLLLGNAFFVGAEFAVMSARRSQIEPLAEAGSKRAKTTLWAMENVSLMLACAQLGITVCSLLILNVALLRSHGALVGGNHVALRNQLFDRDLQVRVVLLPVARPLFRATGLRFLAR